MRDLRWRIYVKSLNWISDTTYYSYIEAERVATSQYVPDDYLIVPEWYDIPCSGSSEPILEET